VLDPQKLEILSNSSKTTTFITKILKLKVK
jgi:hypothetical protein